MQTIKIIPFLVLLLTIPSVFQWLDNDLNNLTAIWWTINTLILFYFFKGKRIYYNNKKLPFYIGLFLIMVLGQTIHGLFRSEGYWDYKNLINNTMVFLLPMSIFIFSQPKVLSNTLHIWLKYALILFWALLPFMQPEAPGRYLIPIMFLTLFIKLIPFKHRLIIILYFLLVFIYGTFGARATAIRYFIALAFGLALYFNIYNRRFFIKFTHIVFILLPLIFFSLGVSGTFNIFKMSDYFGEEKVLVQDSFDQEKQESLTADTRTFIYVEAITSAISEDYYLLGSSLARGYKSVAFSDFDLNKRGERYSSEVSIINIFTYFGLVGAIVYMMIFISASYTAIYKSKNIYMKMIGLYVAFRWMFAWFEDFSRFDLNYLFLWIMISMCFSTDYLYMNNQQFEAWVKTIFASNRNNENSDKINKPSAIVILPKILFVIFVTNGILQNYTQELFF